MRAIPAILEGTKIHPRDEIPRRAGMIIFPLLAVFATQVKQDQVVLVTKYSTEPETPRITIPLVKSILQTREYMGQIHISPSNPFVLALRAGF